MKLSLLDITQRQSPPVPYVDGEKIPWDEPAFSARMLKEHLSQAHDAASRRQAIIDQHVHWIHDTFLMATPARVLDLACGPGFYSNRLAEKGHTCFGIDFSPASIHYALEHKSTKADFVHGDIRTTEYGANYDLALLIFGEFNTFRKTEAHTILSKAYDALKVDGLLVLEPHTFDAVREMGQSSTSWYTRESGLFSEKPHIVLLENHWDKASAITTERYYIVDAASGEVTRWASAMQAYTHDDYAALLTDVGFRDVQFYDTYGEDAPVHDGLLVITCRK